MGKLTPRCCERSKIENQDRVTMCSRRMSVGNREVKVGNRRGGCEVKLAGWN
jgi:hypothetical protein